MSDQPGHEQGAGSPPELTLAQEEQVRRLLADARHDDPLPPDVADRLDRVLAGLAIDPAEPAPVVDLAARRRRRNAGTLLAGAAAVIVAGFGIGQVIDVGDGASDDAAGTAQSDRTDESGDELAAEGGAAEDSAGGSSLRADEAPLELSSGDLAADVDRELAAGPPAASGQAPSPVPGYDCAPAPAGQYGLGELFPALFDGQPAVLALRPRSGDTQEADVLACGTAEELASVTITPR